MADLYKALPVLGLWRKARHDTAGGTLHAKGKSMRYSDVVDLAQRLEALGRQGVRTAEARAFRIWRARANWGSAPTGETWAAIFKAADRAEKWLREHEELEAERDVRDLKLLEVH